MRIVVSGAVWHGFFAPDGLGLEKDFGLPEPERRPVGRGEQFSYDDVDESVATALAHELAERAERELAERGQSHVKRARTRAALLLADQLLASPARPFVLRANHVNACPKRILAISHYRRDGTCRCL